MFNDSVMMEIRQDGVGCEVKSRPGKEEGRNLGEKECGQEHYWGGWIQQ